MRSESITARVRGMECEARRVELPHRSGSVTTVESKSACDFVVIAGSSD